MNKLCMDNLDKPFNNSLKWYTYMFIKVPKLYIVDFMFHRDVYGGI